MTIKSSKCLKTREQTTGHQRRDINLTGEQLIKSFFKDRDQFKRDFFYFLLTVELGAIAIIPYQVDVDMHVILTFSQLQFFIKNNITQKTRLAPPMVSRRVSHSFAVFRSEVVRSVRMQMKFNVNATSYMLFAVVVRLFIFGGMSSFPRRLVAIARSYVLKIRFIVFLG